MGNAKKGPAGRLKVRRKPARKAPAQRPGKAKAKRLTRRKGEALPERQVESTSTPKRRAATRKPKRQSKSGLTRSSKQSQRPSSSKPKRQSTSNIPEKAAKRQTASVPTPVHPTRRATKRHSQPTPPRPKPPKRRAKLPARPQPKRQTVPAQAPKRRTKPPARPQPKRHAESTSTRPKRQAKPTQKKAPKKWSAAEQRRFREGIEVVGLEKTAQLFGVTPATIRRWSAELPKSRVEAAREYLDRVDVARDKARDAARRAQKALKELVQQSYREGVLTKPTRFSRLKDGVNVYGQEAQLPINAPLSKAVIERVVGFLSGFRPSVQHRQWLATVTMSEFMGEEPSKGRDRRTAYPSIIVQIKHRLSRLFTNQVVTASGRRTSRSSMVTVIDKLLRRALADSSLYYVHAAYVLNYEYKTEIKR